MVSQNKYKNSTNKNRGEKTQDIFGTDESNNIT